MPTNRITEHLSRELEPADPKSAALWEIAKQQARERRQQLDAQYNFGREDGYNQGWVHCAVLILGTMLAVAAWRNW